MSSGSNLKTSKRSSTKKKTKKKKTKQQEPNNHAASPPPIARKKQDDALSNVKKSLLELKERDYDHDGDDDYDNRASPTSKGKNNQKLSAETTDILSQLVIQNLGLLIETHSQMGRVIIATKSFNDVPLYSVLLSEKPALVCGIDDHLTFLEEFLACPLPIQAGILDMYHPPLDDSPLEQALTEPVQLLYMLGVLDDCTLIHKLLSIYITNAHQFQENWTALFLFGSKASHSCHPNVAYTSAQGRLEYKIIRPIHKDEQVTFSYLADLYETPTHRRQQQLMETKFFICRCPRCSQDDECRMAKCPHCHSLVPCSFDDSDDCDDKKVHDGIIKDEAHLFNNWRKWTCYSCKVEFGAAVRPAEQALESRLLEIECEVNEGLRNQSSLLVRPPPYSPDELQEIANECSASLSPFPSIRISQQHPPPHAYTSPSDFQ